MVYSRRWRNEIITEHINAFPLRRANKLPKGAVMAQFMPTIYRINSKGKTNKQKNVKQKINVRQTGGAGRRRDRLCMFA